MIYNLSFFCTSVPYYAFEQSDMVGKTVVAILFLGSIITWTIMLDKGMSLFRAKKSSESFASSFRECRHPASLLNRSQRDPSPTARIYESGTSKLADFYGVRLENLMEHIRSGRTHLTTAQIEGLRTIMEREVADQILALEEKTGMLAIAVSVSPFFGLFGTVWGVMSAFCGIAAHGQSDISVLAPGVSGALLTTVVALLVAIPSLIGYNILVVTIRKITVYMDNFVDEYMAKIKLEQMEN